MGLLGSPLMAPARGASLCGAGLLACAPATSVRESGLMTTHDRITLSVPWRDDNQGGRHNCDVGEASLGKIIVQFLWPHDALWDLRVRRGLEPNPSPRARCRRIRSPRSAESSSESLAVAFIGSISKIVRPSPSRQRFGAALVPFDEMRWGCARPRTAPGAYPARRDAPLTTAWARVSARVSSCWIG